MVFSCIYLLNIRSDSSIDRHRREMMFCKLILMQSRNWDLPIIFVVMCAFIYMVIITYTHSHTLWLTENPNAKIGSHCLTRPFGTCCKLKMDKDKSRVFLLLSPSHSIYLTVLGVCMCVYVQSRIAMNKITFDCSRQI